MDAEDDLTRLSRLAREERRALAAVARAEGVGAEDAVDCVQEGLCTLLGMVQRGELPAGGDAWGATLSTIVRNVARNRRRRHFHALPHQPLRDDLVSGDAESGAADVAIARAEEHVRLRACVRELCEIQRAVVTLRMLEERPGEDVASALGITPTYVAVLLHRAKRSLRECMAPGAV